MDRYKIITRLGKVHVYNPSYVETMVGRLGLRPAQAKSARPYLKNN
jgi:hypothetical protein